MAPAPDSAKYKQVTVLFADVVRSMDIAATLDLERLREVMSALLQRVVSVVQRYGGGLVEYTGDGVMALFGAPVALEDHAFRACLAALAIQEEAGRLAVEVENRDGVCLQLRIGLNSGQVIAGEIGSHTLGYTATGETVGFAQRMESAAPPGGVLLSESTARLVEGLVALAEPQWVSVRGFADPVSARRLLAIGTGDDLVRRADASLVGRRWEMAALGALLDRAAEGRGGIVNVVGPAGIGKSRVAREVATLAAARGVEVFWTFCESHARDIPFHAVTRLLRAGTGVAELAGADARARLRTLVPADADPQDVVLLDDLLGIGDPDVPLPQIDPDARRRRLTALINSATLARTTPGLFLIEDVHWIDAASESLLTDLLAVIPRSPSMVVMTSRPEYEGVLMRAHHAQTIALSPLGDRETAELLAELLGDDPSVREITATIIERVCGNPFFAEEMVRELVQRGALTGERGHHVCRTAAADVSVPVTVQAAIEARIDRLGPSSRRALSVASVIGARFDADLLAALGVEPAVDELVKAELVDQVRFGAHPEYTFRHPLIRAVAYESQLRTDRADLHRQVAAVIEARFPAAADENAALIAEHLEAAGEAHAAYRWHMRAATWATYRDISAARRSWERALAIADALPAGDPERTAMRIAPRTMLCGIAWRLHDNVADAHIDELRELCAAAGDKTSLAIGAAGLVIDRAFQGRIREASQLASEVWTLIESLGDATLTVGLVFPVTYPKGHGGSWHDALEWAQCAIDLAGGDPLKGNFLFGCPLAIALATRAFGRYGLGLPGWYDDLRESLAMARDSDPLSYATAAAYVYFPGVILGVLAPDDRALAEIEEAMDIAERTGDDMAVAFTRVIMGLALIHRDSESDRARGRQVLAGAGEAFESRKHNVSELRLLKAYEAGETARRGDRDAALARIRATLDQMTREGQLLTWGLPATHVLVEILLDRGGAGDLAEAETAVERLAAAPFDGGLPIRDIWVLRLRALLARARGEDATWRELAARYRETAETAGLQGHIVWAEAMSG
ncbi:ATP-binding protein [Mycolicibacterium phlei]